MDIMVEGRASRFFKPDQVSMNINFYVKEDSYEKVLKKGVESVEVFIDKILKKFDFTKEDLKTRSFNIREESRYDIENKKSVFDGFSYSQSASLTFDYDIKRVSEMMEAISKLEIAPRYQINFSLKNLANAKSLVLADAYSKAEEKAKMIALAAGKKLKDCIKVDFRPFEERVISQARMDDAMMSSEVVAKRSTSEAIQNIYTPSDVEVAETLYCLWITE